MYRPSQGITKTGVYGVFVAFLAAAPLRLAAGEAEFPSTWRTTEIVIDGTEDDWAGHLVPIPETPVSIGIQNDASFLYLCLRTSDEAMKKRIRAMGLNVYLDATGKSEKSFGIRYPASPERPAAGTGDTPPSESGGTARLRRPASLDELEIIGATADGERIKLTEARPIAVAFAEHDTTLVLEMKVPLAFSADTPIAVRTTPGKTISLGLEGAKPARGDRASEARPAEGDGGGTTEGGRSGGYGGHGGHGGYGGSMGGGGGGFGSGGHGGRWGGGHGHSSGSRDAEGSTANLKKWFRVTLASPPTGPAPGAATPKS
jgi:hypothetical protein